MIEVVLCKRDRFGRKVTDQGRIRLKGTGPWVSGKVDKVLTKHIEVPEDMDSDDYDYAMNKRDGIKERFYGTSP